MHELEITVKVIILFVGIVGFVFECINAFEYLRGTRLYISDPGKGIATALFILCIMRCKLFLFILSRRREKVSRKLTKSMKISFLFSVLLILLNWAIWLRQVFKFLMHIGKNLKISFRISRQAILNRHKLENLSKTMESDFHQFRGFLYIDIGSTN